MEKGRSNYTFEVKCNVNLVNSLIQSYIQANSFKPEEKDGELYYKAGDAMVGYRYFNYSINGNQLTIEAWLKGAFGEIKIEQTGIVGLNMQAMNFRKSLNTLFQEIDKLNNVYCNMNNRNQNLNEQATVNNTQLTSEMSEQHIQQENIRLQHMNNQINQESAPNVGVNEQNQTQVNQSSQFAQTFQDETTKKQEKLCEIGFWLSILGFLASFAGIAYGAIVYLMDFYFAAQGLKTRKKGKAIVTIILSIFSVVIIIAQLFF